MQRIVRAGKLAKSDSELIMLPMYFLLNLEQALGLQVIGIVCTGTMLETKEKKDIQSVADTAAPFLPQPLPLITLFLLLLWPQSLPFIANQDLIADNLQLPFTHM